MGVRSQVKVEVELKNCYLRVSIVQAVPNVSRSKSGGKKPGSSAPRYEERVLRQVSGCAAMKNFVRGDSSTGSELKAVEEACREASRTVESCELCVLCGQI